MKHCARIQDLAQSGLMLAILLVVAGCGTTPSAQRTEVFEQEKLAQIDQSIRQAIDKGKLPGGVFWLETEGATYTKAYGAKSVLPKRTVMERNTVFDVASLTKVLATTPAIMWLWERGRIDLDAPVQRYIPEFKGEKKKSVTLRRLLTHTSGLPAGLSLEKDWTGRDAAIDLAVQAELESPPGSAFQYSDVNFILLGEVVRRISGERLDRFAASRIYKPLGMTSTGFNPTDIPKSRIAPTEQNGEDMLRGKVHDPIARRMGGVAGHAGLFTTASDVARFARMMVNGGKLGGHRLFKERTIEVMTHCQTSEPIEACRGLGWDIDSPYSSPKGKLFPMGSYGHSGFTGGSLWIDPFSDTAVIFLSHRVHPDGEGNVVPLRKRLGTLAAEAVKGVDYEKGATEGATRSKKALPQTVPKGNAGANQPNPAYSKARNGIDVLVENDFKAVEGLKIGLVTNHTGTDRHRKSTIDWLHEAPNVRLAALFSPEHGIRGEREGKVADKTDPVTGLPIHSLYGDSRRPTQEQLAGLDALVFDIQDIGCRFYTYIATMGLAMEAAAKAEIRFFVLDRVNPIGGTCVAGPVSRGDRAFTNFHPIPVRHGMTVGELARMFNREKEIGVDLEVIPVAGWEREMTFDRTALPWINPSPNMRNLRQAFLYPGIGLLERTPLSVGRGTDTPFEVVGAPYIDGRELAIALHQSELNGVRFVPVRFTPSASVFEGKACGGVSITLTGDRTCRTVDIGIVMARTLHELYPQSFELEKFNRLLQHPPTIEAIRAGQPMAEIRRIWKKELAEFKQRREPFLLY